MIYPPLRPRIIVVVETDEQSLENSLEDSVITPAMFLQSGEPELFASVYLLRVSQSHELFDEARFRFLKEEILKALDWADRDRLETQTRFSSAYLPGLLHKAVDHIAQSPLSIFNLIAALRPEQRSDDWVSHIAHYLGQSKAVMSAETQDRMIVSSLLLEAFPPNIHEFHPNNIFRERYRSPCLHALQQIFSPMDTGARSHSIESFFVSCYIYAVGRESSPLDVHAHNLAQFQSIFQHLYSNHSCLGCLVSSPQNSLSYGHALCDACVQRYGQPKLRAESVYFFEKYPLCQRPSLISIVILLSTAAVRALTVNRSGVRVVISLQILLELQDILGPGCPLSDLIDVAWETSAGALVVLDSFFSEQQHGSLLVRWCRTLRAISGRGLYDTDRLEALFRNHYGSSLRLWGSRTSGTKVGVIITSTARGPVILTNYKPVAQRPENISSFASRAHGDALFRLDISLPGPTPPLDAADQMDDLIQQARAQGVGETGRRSLFRLLAQSLFFELASVSERDHRGVSFYCVGVVRCRISGNVFVAAFHRAF
ncbi:hypothetical protein FE257_004352 [Aspergillus nanangensis]|uniref:Uncharacterized protein n=1 Tax=Aspergillus nanangensis TaxID=2582783 RepID=A0AAD4CAR9_ASPNN|nr:hypothetical protein FE257_004352 [Aspergillus nanangensis]